jgi:putative SOS response-associated peptidase YedK
MCYSAQVRQNLHELARRYGANIAYDMFAQLFRRRLDGEDIKASRALEDSFANPGSELESQIKADIDAYRARRVSEWETDLFRQRKRVVDAERSLQSKETRKAREDVRIGTRKIETYLERLADARRSEPKEEDGRIFPMVYAPVIAQIDGRLQIVPMRYTCRLADKPANYDVRYPGTYNARRDSLNGFWREVYGRHHAILVIAGFYENVPRHLYERRDLQPGEAQSNMVLQFKPRPSMDMLVACLWDHWKQPGQLDLWSFAALTDEPPPEISRTGHQRCVITLRDSNLREWLSPADVNRQRLDEILSDRQSVYYEHRIAA